MSESCRGKPQSEPSFIVMLFDYTQVKWKVYLHPMKITFSLQKKERKEKKGVDLFFFFFFSNRKRRAKTNEGRSAV